MIMGLRALVSASTARRTRSPSAPSSAPSAAAGCAATRGISAVRVSTSHGTATTDGPGRPVVASSKARVMAFGTSEGSTTVEAHLVNEDTVACWSGISCRCPMPRPMNWVGISLVTHTVGVLVASEVNMPAPALSTPGPGTTLNTPGRPVDWA